MRDRSKGKVTPVRKRAAKGKEFELKCSIGLDGEPHTIRLVVHGLPVTSVQAKSLATKFVEEYIRALDPFEPDGYGD